MTYFANATDAEIYQANYCQRCQHFKPASMDSLGCPVLNLHFDHNNDDAWKPYLDEMIPPAPSPVWHGECAFFSEVNMVPDRLYQPPPPEWLTLLSKARYSLAELARECEEYAQAALEVDGHSYVFDGDPNHACNESCPTKHGYTSTGMWLHQSWAVDLVKEIDKFIDMHGQAVENKEEGT